MIVVIGIAVIVVGLAVAYRRRSVASRSLEWNKKHGVGWDGNNYESRKDEPYWLVSAALVTVTGLLLATEALVNL